VTDTKPSNPKDIIGSAKLDLGLAPDTMEVMAAEAFLEGALKYGRYNWRIKGVRASTYHAALKRHIKKWWNGQNRDKKTNVHHLCNAMACIVIMYDAELYGKFEDDRPPCPNPDAMAELIDRMESQVAHLKSLFADHKPHQYTIKDTPQHEDGAAFVGEPPTEAELDELLDAQLNGAWAGAFRVSL
jgi:hypothetical protein